MGVGVELLAAAVETNDMCRLGDIGVRGSGGEWRLSVSKMRLSNDSRRFFGAKNSHSLRKPCKKSGQKIAKTSGKL